VFGSKTNDVSVEFRVLYKPDHRYVNSSLIDPSKEEDLDHH